MVPEFRNGLTEREPSLDTVHVPFKKNIKLKYRIFELSVDVFVYNNYAFIYPLNSI